MEIRHSAIEDIGRIMEIYEYARSFMAKTGNPHQWAEKGWPPEELILQDIGRNCSYVCTRNGHIIGTFFYRYGQGIEPTYSEITDGSWIGDDTYGVVHRIAGDGSEKGIGSFCIGWAYEQSGHLRIDTHGDNKPMQNLLKKLGFTRCGTIYVAEDHYPRIAYEKL